MGPTSTLQVNCTDNSAGFMFSNAAKNGDVGELHALPYRTPAGDGIVFNWSF